MTQIPDPISLRRLRPHRTRLILGSALTAVGGLVTLAPAVLLGRLIDSVTAVEWVTSDVLLYIALIVVVALFGTALHSFANLLSIGVTQDLYVDLRADVARRLFELPVISHYARPAGSSVSMLTDDIESLDTNITDWLLNAITSLVVGIGALVIIFLVDPVLALVALASLPVSYAVSAALAPLAHKARLHRQTVFGNFVGSVQERSAIDGLMLIKSFQTAEVEVENIVSRAREVADATKVEARQWEYYRSATASISALFPLAMWLVGGYRFSKGALTIGELVVIVTLLLPRFVSAGNQLSSLKPTLKRAQASLFRVEALMAELGDESNRGAEVRSEPQPSGDICLQGVTFSYPDHEASELTKGWSLRDISIRIEQGESLAVVGRSGAGKTTLGLLMAGLLEPQSGSIRVFGRNPADHEPGLAGLVPQDPYILHDSLRSNIAYGREVTDRELLSVVADASIEFVGSLSDGFDTVLGDRGVRLSGGQKQRVALARALVGNPKMLVLDEATSNLDAETQHFVQQSLRSLDDDMTTIVIAHRLSTVRTCDRVLLLEDGRIEALGTHASLMKSSGLYRGLVELELSRDIT